MSWKVLGHALVVFRARLTRADKFLPDRWYSFRELTRPIALFRRVLAISLLCPFLPAAAVPVSFVHLLQSLIDDGGGGGCCCYYPGAFG